MSERPTASVEFLRSTGRIAMAHRGFTSFRFPMNSMAAFAEAVQLGFRYLETDARATRDGSRSSCTTVSFRSMPGRMNRSID